MVVSSATFGFPVWESFFAHAQRMYLELVVLPRLLGSASTSSVPVTQCKCNAVLCKPQGFPLHWEEGRWGTEAQLASCGSTCVYRCVAVSQKLAKGARRGVCLYSKLWHLNGCHVASCGTAGSTWGRKFKLYTFQP